MSATSPYTSRDRQPIVEAPTGTTFVAYENPPGVTTNAVASLGLTFAGVGMTAGRFTGDAVIARFGRRRTIAWSGCIASAGIALALVGGSTATALIGFGCFGIGVATIVPTAFYVAGNTRRVPPAWGMAQVTTMGYAGLLSSPSVIGFVSHAAGLRWALAIPAVLLLVVPALSRATPGRSDQP